MSSDLHAVVNADFPERGSAAFVEETVDQLRRNGEARKGVQAAFLGESCQRSKSRCGDTNGSSRSAMTLAGEWILLKQNSLVSRVRS
jgi:hypothetical protein